MKKMTVTKRKNEKDKMKTKAGKKTILTSGTIHDST
jgi:hypothetical protein